jgi:hypothetical protein
MAQRRAEAPRIAPGRGRPGSEARDRDPDRPDADPGHHRDARDAEARGHGPPRANASILLKTEYESGRPADIKRSRTTVPGRESSNPRHVVGSSPSLRSADSITATSASPDHRTPRPTLRSVLGSSRPPPAVWRSTVASAPASPCGPSHLRREDAASNPGRSNPAWSHRDTGADEVSNRDRGRGRFPIVLAAWR